MYLHSKVIPNILIIFILCILMPFNCTFNWLFFFILVKVIQRNFEWENMKLIFVNHLVVELIVSSSTS